MSDLVPPYTLEEKRELHAQLCDGFAKGKYREVVNSLVYVLTELEAEMDELVTIEALDRALLEPNVGDDGKDQPQQTRD